MSDESLYDQLGGEAGLRKLVERFYHHMETLPEAREIREMHPPDLANAHERLFCFLSGWLGGPQLFMEKFGHPRLWMRHARFPIGKQERDLWLQCMLLALDDVGIVDPLRFFVMDALLKVADHMRNKSE